MSTSTRAAAIAAALLLAIPFSACSPDESSHGSASAGGKSASALLEEATALIGSDEWKGALVKIDLVLADGKATPAEHAEAWQAKVVCEGRVNGDDPAIAALAKLTEAKVELTPTQYAKMGNDLAEAERLKAALAVIERATEKYKDDPTAKKQLGRLASMLGRKLEAAGDSDSQKKLKALGYLGGSSDEDEEPPAKKSDGPARN